MATGRTAGKPKRGSAPQRRGRPEPSEPARGPRDTAIDWIKSGIAAFLLFLVLRTFLVQTFVITSSSMEATLLVGDFLVLNKAAYGPVVPLTRWRIPGYAEPGRGDVAVFRPPHDPGLDVVKRIVGLPGDTLAMVDKRLLLNGVPVGEEYARYSDLESDVAHPWMRWQCGEPVVLSPDISGAYRITPLSEPLSPGGTDEPCRPTRDNWGPLIVPPGNVFMMGDNRDDSVDSRYWGFLDMERLKGRAVFIYYSYDSGTLRPFPFLTAIRWHRIGDGIG